MHRYAVMGNPVKHSRSPYIHSRFAQETDQAISYEAIEVPLDQFPQFVQAFRNGHGKGLNITVPFKQQAYQLATELSERAKLAKAVNTLAFREDGTVFGDNTDGIGLLRDLTVNLGCHLATKNILILGAGGATRGILGPLLEQAPQKLVIANRTLATAQALCAEFKSLGNVQAVGLDDISGSFDLIINATSSSVKQEALRIESNILTESSFCYDLTYGQEPTPFLQWALNHGVRNIADGTGMLVEQAAESFYIWRGIRPTTSTVIKELNSKKEVIPTIRR